MKYLVKCECLYFNLRFYKFLSGVSTSIGSDHNGQKKNSYNLHVDKLLSLFSDDQLKKK